MKDNEKYTYLDLEELQDGKTYMLTFPEEFSISEVTAIVENINGYLKEKNRDIVMIYKESRVKIEEVK